MRAFVSSVLQPPQDPKDFGRISIFGCIAQSNSHALVFCLHSMQLLFMLCSSFDCDMVAVPLGLPYLEARKLCSRPVTKGKLNLKNRQI